MPEYFFRQSAVVPYRWWKGQQQILLITSHKGRWIVPKGVIEPDLSPEESAAAEAWEEAGVRGIVDPDPLGRYQDRKWGGVCDVVVFPMRVTDVLREWPEENMRERRWVSWEDAEKLVSKQELIRLFGVLRQRIGAVETQDGGKNDSRGR